MKFQHLVLLCLVVPLFGQVKISAPDVSINNDGEAIIKIDFSASKTFEESELIFSCQEPLVHHWFLGRNFHLARCSFHYSKTLIRNQRELIPHKIYQHEA